MNPKRRQWSILTRLMFWYGLSFSLLTLVSNILLYFLLVKTAESDRNSILSDRMSAVSALLKSPSHGKSELLHRVNDEWPTRGGEKVYLRIASSDGEIIQTKDFPVEFENNMEALKSSEKISDPKLQLEGKDGKLRLAHFEVMENSVEMKNPIYVFGLIDADQSQAFLDQYKRIAISILISSALLSLLIGLQIARKGIRPLLAMTKEVANISSGTLHERLTLSDLPIELHKLAVAFNQTLDSLEEAFERLSRFSSDIAHELRTPLTNILGEIEVALAKPRTNNDYTEIMSSTLEDCNRLKQIIESLLFLARSENLKNDLKLEKLDLNSEISSILEFFEPAAVEAGIELKLQTEILTNQCISGEKILFQRALGNLLSNAIYYTTAGGTITVRLSKTNDTFVRLEVTDNGIGIAPEHLSRIFDRFYRVDSNRNWATGGVGLGLSIVKSIVDIHKGKIEINSKLHAGTHVLISWPALSVKENVEDVLLDL